MQIYSWTLNTVACRSGRIFARIGFIKTPRRIRIARLIFGQIKAPCFVITVISETCLKCSIYMHLGFDIFIFHTNSQLGKMIESSFFTKNTARFSRAADPDKLV